MKSGLTRSQVLSIAIVIITSVLVEELSNVHGWLGLELLCFVWVVEQVSNWFINARVRLWKPLIEEMHAEMDRRKACCRNEEEMEGSIANRISMMSNRRFNVN